MVDLAEVVELSDVALGVVPLHVLYGADLDTALISLVVGFTGEPLGVIIVEEVSIAPAEFVLVLEVISSDPVPFLTMGFEDGLSLDFLVMIKDGGELGSLGDAGFAGLLPVQLTLSDEEVGVFGLLMVERAESGLFGMASEVIPERTIVTEPS